MFLLTNNKNEYRMLQIGGEKNKKNFSSEMDTNR